MSKVTTVTATGSSGKQYSFDVYHWGQAFNPVPAVYMVLKQASNGSFDILYIGQTSNLNERFDSHHKQRCFDRNRKTHIAIHQEAKERVRLDKETDLVSHYNPVCNG